MTAAKKIVFQGEPGANSHLASRDVYPDYEPVPCATFEDAFAAINSGVLDRDDTKAWALPWKIVASEAGLPVSLSTLRTAATASPIATPGLRLKEIVTDGKIP